MITEYANDSSSCSGDFVAYGNGWVGKESGNATRTGYFEFVEKRFELVDSPKPSETDRLLDELEKYYKEMASAYKQAELNYQSAMLAKLEEGETKRAIEIAQKMLKRKVPIELITEDTELDLATIQLLQSELDNQ